MMKNKFKKALQAAVILSCATLFPWQAMAAGVEEVEYEVYENEFFYNNNNTKPYFTADIVVLEKWKMMNLLPSRSKR